MCQHVLSMNFNVKKHASHNFTQATIDLRSPTPSSGLRAALTWTPRHARLTSQCSAGRCLVHACGQQQWKTMRCCFSGGGVSSYGLLGSKSCLQIADILEKNSAFSSTMYDSLLHSVAVGIFYLVPTHRWYLEIAIRVAKSRNIQKWAVPINRPLPSTCQLAICLCFSGFLINSQVGVFGWWFDPAYLSGLGPFPILPSNQLLA